MVVSVSLLLEPFPLHCMKGALAGTDMERFVLGIAEPSFCMSAVAWKFGNRAMVTAELVVVVLAAAAAAISWFAKRFLAPLCMCVAQYFWPGRTALLHCHFLPSVLRHLSGADSMLVLSIRWDGLLPKTENGSQKKPTMFYQFSHERFVLLCYEYNINTLKMHNIVFLLFFRVQQISQEIAEF